MRRLRALSEAECYARCYLGWEPTVTVLRFAPQAGRAAPTITGEDIRKLLEERLDARLAGIDVEAA